MMDLSVGCLLGRLGLNLWQFAKCFMKTIIYKFYENKDLLIKIEIIELILFKLIIVSYRTYK